jgi:hypothetical protein
MFVNTSAFVGTNPTGELITSGLPVTGELFGDLMPCTLLSNHVVRLAPTASLVHPD